MHLSVLTVIIAFVRPIGIRPKRVILCSEKPELKRLGCSLNISNNCKTESNNYNHRLRASYR
jgi:hypothetical protein